MRRASEVDTDQCGPIEVGLCEIGTWPDEVAIK